MHEKTTKAIIAIFIAAVFLAGLVNILGGGVGKVSAEDRSDIPSTTNYSINPSVLDRSDGIVSNGTNQPIFEKVQASNEELQYFSSVGDRGDIYR